MKEQILIAFAKRFMAFMLSLFTAAGCAGAPVVLPQEGLAQGADVRIVQFNLRTTGINETSVAYRAPLMVAELNEIGADSMGFQEANLRWMLYLEENLTDYAYVGVGRSDGKVSGEFSPVFYLKDKYSLVDGGTFWLSDTPDKPGSKYIYSANIRICSWAILENRETGERYCHFNTHLDHISSKARENQVKVLLKKINEIAGSYPVVLTGDFNDDGNSAMYSSVTSLLKDTRLASPATDDKGTYHNYGQVKSPRIIDFVFVSQDVTPLVYHVIDDKVDGVYLSDHFGIYTDIAFA